jgi:hypothetical protein
MCPDQYRAEENSTNTLQGRRLVSEIRENRPFSGPSAGSQFLVELKDNNNNIECV